MNATKTEKSTFEKLLAKIDELIKDCPSNWATLAADKMGKAVSTIRKIKNGELGKLDNSMQIELIKALKAIKSEYQTDVNQALA